MYGDNPIFYSGNPKLFVVVETIFCGDNPIIYGDNPIFYGGNMPENPLNKGFLASLLTRLLTRVLTSGY